MLLTKPNARICRWQTIGGRKSSHRNRFLQAGGALYLILPYFSVNDAARMFIYRLTAGVFMQSNTLASQSSYGVSVFQQDHDVYMYIWRRLNLTGYDDSGDIGEKLSWSPLFKWK